MRPNKEYGVVRQLHFDCFAGISGDMTLAALLDAGVPEQVVQEALSSLGLEGQLKVSKVRKNGFAATRIVVESPPLNKHRHLSHIHKIIEAGNMPESARLLARKLFDRLGEAEAASHGIPIEKVHFHEVGAVDSIFDFVGIAVALDWLKVDRYTARPVPTGHGMVKCDHGLLPIPPPAVAFLLRDIPLASFIAEGELTTPTGAAVVASLTEQFTSAPAMTIRSIGIGAGSRDYTSHPNILRVLIGDADTAPAVKSQGDDSVWVLESNIDDATPEVIGFTIEQALSAGALDAFAIPIMMKKSRPGVMLTLICNDSQLPELEQLVFRETGTFGIRRRRMDRSKRDREMIQVDLGYGSVRGKVGRIGDNETVTPEYEDCATLARQRHVPLNEIYQAFQQAVSFKRPSSGSSNERELA